MTLPSGYEAYGAVWQEAQNADAVEVARGRLLKGHAMTIILQPGDSTRYRFMLVPEPLAYVVSDDGRDFERKSGDTDVLYVTVLDGLGKGTAQIHRRNGIDGIRYRIADGMDVPNPCTAEALAQTVLAVWAYGETPLESSHG